MRFSAVVARRALLLALLPLAAAQAQRVVHPRPAPASSPATTALQSTAIEAGWQFHALALTPAAPNAESPQDVLRQHPEAATWRAATVPGTVHTDLAAVGVIPPPFTGDNEKRLQWIGQLDWQYRTTFSVSPAQLAASHAELVFDGLDTFADVELNGQPLLHTDNMFRRYTADLAHGGQARLQAGDNTLTITFHSAINTTAPAVAKLPYILPGTGYEPTDAAHGIYPLGQFQRKAGYEYGWDWGPRFVTAGVFRPIHLDTWSGDRIRNLAVQTPEVSTTVVRGTVDTTIDADQPGPAELSLALTDPTGHPLPPVAQHIQLHSGTNHLFLPLALQQPALWYPAGYGPQSRYTVAARVLRNARPTASLSFKTGFRSVELRRDHDEWGTSFEFVINGVPVFAKGANVIPTDSFAPATTPARERDLLTSARDANMNMFRIWGGGYYQTDTFYDLCDELGIMVWQDFMFGAGMVPGDKAFQQNVVAEATEQVERLAPHPAVTVWNGNNEVEAAWNHWDGQKQFIASITPDQREQVWQDYVVIFRDILKSAVALHGNGVPYWPSSPSSNFENPQIAADGSVQNGDTHSWTVWSAGAPAADYTRQKPRFLSEFGFQSLPDLRTLQSVVGEDTDLDSPELANHERFVHGFTRMRDYLNTNFLPARDFASTIYLSQLLQAQAIRIAVDHARANRPHTMGTLFWQLDDCWPVASWASLDYFGRWKTLQYWARHFYAPVSIAPELDDGSHTLRLHLVSDDTVAHAATLHLRVLHLNGKLLDTPQADQRIAVTLPPLASTAVPPIPLASLPGFDPSTTVVVATLAPNPGDPAGISAAARSNLSLDTGPAGLDGEAAARPTHAAPRRSGGPSRNSALPVGSAIPASTVANYPGSPSYPLIPSAEVDNPVAPTTLAERTIYFADARHLALTEPHISAHMERAATGYIVTLTTESLAVAVDLSFGNLNWKLSDNDFDLFPGERRQVHLTSTATQDQLETALHTRSLFSATTH